MIALAHPDDIAEIAQALIDVGAERVIQTTLTEVPQR
jgi:hypothetical protein